MNWSWHAFTIFRIPVRFHWTLLFVVVYHFAGPVKRGEDSQFLAFIGLSILLNFAIILFHELGHSWAARRVGGHVDKILLWPLGGFAYVGHSDEPRTDMFVAVSGPATHILFGGASAGAILLLGLPWDWNWINPLARELTLHGTSIGEWLLYMSLQLNVYLFCFNLFVPAFPLDGGRILLDFLRMRMGDWRANRTAGTISLVIGVALLMIAVVMSNIMLGLVSVLVIVQAIQLRSLSPDAEYSSHGYSDRGYRFEEPRKEGYFARRRRLKRERELARRDAEEAAFQDRVNEILDKLTRSGRDSLTPAELKTLEQASQKQKGKG